MLSHQGMVHPGNSQLPQFEDPDLFIQSVCHLRQSMHIQQIHYCFRKYKNPDAIYNALAGGALISYVVAIPVIRHPASSAED